MVNVRGSKAKLLMATLCVLDADPIVVVVVSMVVVVVVAGTCVVVGALDVVVETVDVVVVCLSVVVVCIWVVVVPVPPCCMQPVHNIAAIKIIAKNNFVPFMITTLAYP